ncbi:MAG: hypothetical protein K5681_06725 [Treponema sp.]|nr:hypothetical protein [Treponema sp.]
MKKTSSLVLASLLVFASLFSEDEKFRGWKTAETQHFNFIYEDSARESAAAFAEIADDAWNKVAGVYGFPQEKTDIYVTDRMNFVNALTYAAPVEIMMFTIPLTMVDFTFRDNWRQLFFTHELIHSANFAFEDRPGKKLFSTLFGPAATTLFDYNSSWSLEGLTTVLETELLNGGRGRSPYFELDYKAATLDNAFPSYQEVEKNGTSYVIGYLMMRSVADRWGLNTLADIERNRPLYGSWDEAVKLVTGENAEDIYKDMRISLAKKYANERKIPEGLIISPRDASYYKPAIVLDDGSLITLRSTDDDFVSIVKLDPSAKSGRNKLRNTHPEKDLNTLYQETVLFRTQIMYSDSYTADENSRVYITLQEESLDSMPGIRENLPIYSWTQKTGLKKLTKKGSFFQPSVSRNGKVLVAVQQKGLKMRLVQIDTESGEVKPILENPEYDFLQPAVNDDGTKVAFLAVDGKRAKVCVMELTGDGSVSGDFGRDFSVVENGDGQIVDPAFPAWNSNGKLTFTSNDRGRLEVYELALNGTEAAGKKVPVLADPIGALWAYQGEKGIYYWSTSASGLVIKMKPSSEWGKVPSFNGPSMPGEIIHFGDLQRDYPDFKPYEQASEIEESLDRIKEEKEKKQKKNLTSKTKVEEDSPIPVEPKKVYRRPEELQEKAENLPEASGELTNEHTYIPTIKPLLYFPLFDFNDFSGFAEDSIFGFGGAFLGLWSRLQYMPGEIVAGGLYYPAINNFSGSLVALIPVGNIIFAGTAVRDLYSRTFDGQKHFAELNSFSLLYQHFLYLRSSDFSVKSFSLVGIGQYNLIRHDDKLFAFYDNADVKNAFNLRLGVNLLNMQITERMNYASYQCTLYGIADYNFDYNKTYFGAEAQLGISPKFFDFLNPNFALNIRYTDFPAEYTPTYSTTAYSNEYLDCSYPGRMKLKAGLSLFLGQVFAETIFSYGKNSINYETPDNGSFMNLTWSKTLEAGYALTLEQFFNVGVTYQFNFENDDLSHWNFYWSVSLGALQL